MNTGTCDPISQMMIKITFTINLFRAIFHAFLICLNAGKQFSLFALSLQIYIYRSTSQSFPSCFFYVLFDFHPISVQVISPPSFVFCYFVYQSVSIQSLGCLSLIVSMFSFNFSWTFLNLFLVRHCVLRFFQVLGRR